MLISSQSYHEFSLSDEFEAKDGIDQVESLTLVEKERRFNISYLAFADDTIFIVSMQSNLQKILDKTNKFYCINDIDINSKKSVLVVVNSKMMPRQQIVRLERKRAKVKAIEVEKAAHFLG
ncbi:15099_t:CDS:2, partial [Gigaspora margarita]